MKRYGNKRDANEAEIVSALRAIGCSVYLLDLPVDLVVGYRARNFLIEVKDGNKPPSARKKTEQQKIFMRGWNGQVRVVETADEAIRLVTGSYRNDERESEDKDRCE